MSLDDYTNSSPSQQERNVVLLRKDKLPPEVHITLCTDSETYARHDHEGCSL